MHFTLIFHLQVLVTYVSRAWFWLFQYFLCLGFFIIFWGGFKVNSGVFLQNWVATLAISKTVTAISIYHAKRFIQMNRMWPIYCMLIVLSGSKIANLDLSCLQCTCWWDWHWLNITEPVENQCCNAVWWIDMT